MKFRIVPMAFVVASLLACSEASSPEITTATPEKWQYLKITEVGRIPDALRSDENALHIHFKDWTYAALLEDVFKSMKAAGYEHTRTTHDDRFFGFERPGEQLMLKIDGGDGNLYVDIINGKGGGADWTMHQMTFGNPTVKEVVLRSGDQVSIKRYSIEPAGPLQLASPFDLEAVKFVKEPGNATVTGRAFLELGDGALKDCAGFNIELLPAAAYSNERIFRTYGNNQQGQVLLAHNPPTFTPDVKEYHEMVLKGACNAKGEFQFKNVPAGDYYVMAFIIWETRPGDATSKTGGGVMKRLFVEPNSTNVVRLN